MKEDESRLENPKGIYERRRKYYNKMLEKQNKALSIMSNLRLIVALAGIGNTVFLYVSKSYSLILTIPLTYIIIFIYLVLRHNKSKNTKKYISSLYKINDDALKRLNGDWKTFVDTGDEFCDENHSFAKDLDVFGQGSLYQWINVAKTYMGRQKLKKLLTEPCTSKDEIYKRQEAVGELAERLWWRQRFMAEGMLISDKNREPEFLYNWAEERDEFYLKPWVIAAARLLPILSIMLGILYFTNNIPYHFPLMVLLIQILMLKFKNKKRSKILNTVYKHKDNIKAYRQMLRQFEKNHFKSVYLKELKNNLMGSEKRNAFQQIDRLEKIVEYISNRSNAVFIFINIIILWDYQCMIALERWKRKSGILIKTWLDTIGEAEALSSLAGIRYDNRDWIMPEIVDKPSYLKARHMGHPLLTNKRVFNDLIIEPPAKILLITGSNMSGKSTLLRTAGINLLLAYVGAPVCAEFFHCSIMSIHTCMRVSDNLEKNISSFYAELLRIKDIVKAAKEQQVFFLLDEIFKGTNSEDRHEGAKILIRKLLGDGAIGLVSTHDLELGILEEESNKKIKNYHFQEHYKNNEIHFDYKLRPGISTTRNAMYLIKMIGIKD